MTKWLKPLLIALFSLLVSSSTFAQGSFFTGNAWRYTPAGVFAASTATVTVCTSAGAGAPCTPTISLFKDAALANPVSNPLPVCGTPLPQFGCIDGLGNFSFYAATTGPYVYTITGAGLTAYGPIPISAITNSIGLGTNNAFTGNNTMSQLNNVVIVDGVKYPLTDAGIQSAITAAEAIGSGSAVFMPCGTYNVGANLPILISSRVSLIGCGWSTFLLVAATVPATTDVILVQPTGSGVISGIRIQDFQILPASGHPARHAIQLDGTNGLITEIIIDHVIVLNGLGSSAINAVGAGNGGSGAQGTPALSTLQNLSLVGGSASPAGGITFSNSGDTNRILNGRISGPGACIDASNFVLGASTFIVDKVNLSCDGGSVHIGSNAVAPQITNNEVETGATFTGSHNALIDFDGTDDIGGAGTVGVEGGIIKDNSCQVVNAITADCIRLNNANAVTVGEANRFGHGVIGTCPGAPGVCSHDITITANATNSIISNNEWLGTANAGNLTYNQMVNDSGVNTSFLGVGAFLGVPGPTLAPNGLLYGVQDTPALPYKVLQSNSAGGTTFYGFHNNLLASGSQGASYLYDGSASSNIALAMTGGASSAAVVAGSMATTRGLSFSEETVPSATAAFDVCYGDSTAHAVKCSFNNGTFFNIPQVIATSTATMTTAAIASLACGTTVTVSATGVLTTDPITWSFNAAPAANPGELVVSAWPTANNVNFQYCNPTAGSVTPNAATLIWKVVR